MEAPLERHHACEQHGAGERENPEACLAQAVVAALRVAHPRRPPRHREADEANRCENDEEEYPKAALTFQFVLLVVRRVPRLAYVHGDTEGEDDDGDAQAEPERDRIAPRRRRIVGPAHEDGAAFPFLGALDSCDSEPPAAVLLAVEAAQLVKP